MNSPILKPAARAQIDHDAAVIRPLLDQELSALQARDGIQTGGSAVLIVLCGLPGAGKSHFAGELLKRLNLVVLETDRLRKALVTRPKYTRGEHGRVFSVCHLLIEEYLIRGHRVLFDATNFTEKARSPLYQIADRLDCPMVMVGLTAPSRLVKERLSRRVPGQNQGDFSDATWEIHRRMAPYEEPIEQQHILVDSSKDIGPLVDQVVEQVAALGRSAGAGRDIP